MQRQQCALTSYSKGSARQRRASKLDVHLLARALGASLQQHQRPQHNSVPRPAKQLAAKTGCTCRWKPHRPQQRLYTVVQRRPRAAAVTAAEVAAGLLRLQASPRAPPPALSARAPGTPWTAGRTCRPSHSAQTGGCISARAPALCIRRSVPSSEDRCTCATLQHCSGRCVVCASTPHVGADTDQGRPSASSGARGGAASSVVGSCVSFALSRCAQAQGEPAAP